MRLFGSGFLKCLSGVAVFGVLISFIASSVDAIEDGHIVAQLTAKMKTVCVGRFLIDLPAEADVTIRRGFVSGFHLASTPDESDSDFWRRIDEVEKGIDVGPGRNELSNPELAKLISFNDVSGKLWIYKRHRTSMPGGGTKATVDDVSIRSDIRVRGMSLTATAEAMPANVAARLEQFLKQIRPLTAGELPREPGFCIEHAIVRDPYEHGNTESVVMFAGLPGHADVKIAFSSMAGTAPSPGLLDRNATSSEREPFYVRMAFTTLAGGKRVIHGIAGEELRLRVREPNLTTGFSFQWEAAGKRDNIHAPLLTLELDAGTNPVNGGKPVQSSLSEEALTVLWERIAGSIRPRPVETAQAAAAKSVAGTLRSGATQ